jgi:hypothetical protein
MRAPTSAIVPLYTASLGLEVGGNGGGCKNLPRTCWGINRRLLGFWIKGGGRSEMGRDLEGDGDGWEGGEGGRTYWICGPVFEVNLHG